ncbi:integrating conjugative element protein [Pseudomaricurvus alkylphenolicus]|uniref:integrating conjugative element protein n=1 Tax=Pseudomaricurvus alkylphenolicus TaxID=1306991 RepID=UPI0014226FB2|nr:integrating conjugative element protein [Pseudomaricurvus alkylphenolicus]NIB44038.1 integrating conjugative element protein [Pseudomaricurvus alkylphenolicus]
MTLSYRSTLIVLVLLYSCGLQAELTVIHDSGDTQPLTPYLEVLQQPQNVRPQRPVDPDQALRSAGPAHIENLLPIRSPGLRPGALSKSTLPKDVQKRLTQGIPRPFFLVGSDPLSEQWLRQHRAKLIEIGAVGMLVQADNAEDVRRMASVGQGLRITLGSGSDVAKSLGLTQYPVLITTKGLEQ